MTEKQTTILIVDDEEAVRRLLQQKLSGEGYHCEEADSAEQAVDKLRNNAVELVLLDIKMPGKSGTELLSEIKANYPDTAVIMATAVTDIHIAIQCMKQGAYDYLTKPFNLDEVALSIDRALEKRRLELENRDYQQHLEQRVEAQARKIRASFLNAVTALAYALEAKDKYTSGHSQRVAETSVAIATELGMPQDSIEKIRLAGLIHDIGKIGVRESVLNKPSGLTKEEFQHVKYHPEIGEHILTPIVKDEEVLKMVRHHHEHYDGTGFPDGLAGEQIPLGARILALADSYDAMTSERPYREAVGIRAACAEIERSKGTQFDPEVADAFLRIRKFASSVVDSPQGTVSKLVGKIRRRGGMGTKRVLIADDEPNIRLMVSGMLSKDYIVIRASDGDEAINIARNQKPDLILMDIMMPKLDGYTACHAIKTDPATKAIPVVMLTALGYELNKKLAQEIGTDGYITKPFSSQELLDIVNRFLANPE